MRCVNSYSNLLIYLYTTFGPPHPTSASDCLHTRGCLERVSKLKLFFSKFALTGNGRRSVANRGDHESRVKTP